MRRRQSMFKDVHSIDDFKLMFDKAFASEEYEVLTVVDKTLVVNHGITTVELVKQNGYADYRVNLGPKTIMVYGPMRY